MTDVSKMFESGGKSIRAADLKGHEVTVKISSYKTVDFDDGPKLILSFEGKEKGLTLNKTNGRKLVDAFGGDAEGWLGKEIILYPDTTTFGPDVVDCVRIRVPLPAKVADFDDDIPF